MQTIKTGNTPIDDKTNYIVECLEIDQNIREMKLKIKADSYTFFVNRLERIVDLSGIDDTEEMTFSCMPNPDEKTLTFYDNIPQALAFLFSESAISKVTFDEYSTLLSNRSQSFRFNDLPDTIIHTIALFIPDNKDLYSFFRVSKRMFKAASKLCSLDNSNLMDDNATNSALISAHLIRNRR